MNFYAPGLDTVTLSEEGVAMQINLPKGGVLMRSDGNPVELVLYGPDSLKYPLALAQMRKDQTEWASANPNASEEVRVLANRQRTAEFIAAMLKSWNVQTESKKGEYEDAPITAAPDFFKAFPFATDQADAFIANRARFTKAS